MAFYKEWLGSQVKKGGGKALSGLTSVSSHGYGLDMVIRLYLNEQLLHGQPIVK